MGSKTSGNREGRRGRPLPTRYTISRPAAIWLREVTRTRLGRRDVGKEEIEAVLEAILKEAAMNIQIWQNVTTGDVYAVQAIGSAVYAAAGPLHHREVKAALAGFNSDPELVDDLNAAGDTVRALSAHEIDERF